jgi:hypothetical protein
METHIMTQEDRATVVGLAVMAKDAAEKKLAGLRGHAGRLGTRFSRLGGLLSTNPESIRFEEKIIQKVQSGFQPLEPLRFTDFDPYEIGNLAEEIRTAIAELEQAKAQAAKHGF